MQYTLPFDNGNPVSVMHFEWVRVTGPADHRPSRGMKHRPLCDLVNEEAKHGVVEVDLGENPPFPAPPHGQGGSVEVTISGLEAGGHYDVRVCAGNSHGLGPSSKALRVACSARRPDPPQQVRHLVPTVAGVPSLPTTESYCERAKGVAHGGALTARPPSAPRVINFSNLASSNSAGRASPALRVNRPHSAGVTRRLF